MAVKKDIGKRLAFAGIGTAISLIFVVLAYFIKNLSLSFYVLSAGGVMLPLTKGYFREGFLTSVAVSVAGFFIVNVSIVPFVMASGFYVVASIFLYEKKFNRWIGYLIKLAYSAAVFFVCYKVLTLIMIDLTVFPTIGNLSPAALYAVLNVIFSLAFILYDFLMEKAYEYLKKLLEKILKSN